MSPPVGKATPAPALAKAGLLAIVLAVAGPAGAAHRFVCVDNGANRLLYIDEFEPARNWRVDVPAGSRDVQRLDADRVLLSHGDGCGIYRLSDGQLLWSLAGFAGVQTAHYRPDRQEILLGANAADGYVFHVLERDGAWFRRTGRVLRVPGVKSGFLRLVRLTPEGRLLFAAGEPYRIVEWDPERRETVWTGALPGKGYMAIRRADGTTLATTGDAVSVVVLGRDGQVVQTYLGEAHRRAHALNWFSGLCILSNGNLVVANWLGHGATGKGPHLVEVDAQNRVVWTWTDHTAAQQVTALAILEEPQ